MPPAAVQFCRGIPRMDSDMIVMSFVAAGWPLLVAYCLLHGAPLIMRIAYPDATSSTVPETPSGAELEKKANA